MLDRYSSSRSGAAVLDRPQPSTATEPVLQPVSAEMAVAGGTEDSSVTVIENPALSGLTGLLISRSFFESSSGRILRGALHLRIDRSRNVKSQEEYPLLALAERRGQANLWAVLAVNHIFPDILPSLSTRPYIICFISPEDYKKWHGVLSKRGDRAEAIKELYKFLAETKYPDFKLNEEGNLALPPDYAAVEMVRGLTLFK